MRYVLSCTCGSKIPVHRSQAGSRVECAECGKVLEIPTIRGFSDLEIEGESSSSDSLVKRPRRWTTLKGSIAAICFVLALVGLGRSGLYAYFRWMNPTPFSESDMLREAQQVAAEFTPAETWDTWTFLQESGLGQKKNPPPALIAKRLLETQDISMTRWAAAGMVGLFGLLASILLGNRNREEKG